MTNNEDVTHLTFADKEILLIGTAHVSKASADLVSQVIDREKPDTVCVELTAPATFRNPDSAPQESRLVLFLKGDTRLSTSSRPSSGMPRATGSAQRRSQYRVSGGG